MAISSVPSTTTIVPFLLKQDNYEDWRIYMENYLLAQDLWGIIESGDDTDFLSSSNDVGNWGKKNAAALHAVHTTSSADIFAQIKEIRSAKDAWNKLAKMHQEWQSKSKPKTGMEGWDGGEEDEITDMTHSEGSNRTEEEDEITDMPHSKGSDGGKEDKMIEDSHRVKLKKSICEGDWNTVERFFVFDERPLNAKIFSGDNYTALHGAIQAGHDKITEKLVEMMSVTDLEIKCGPAIHVDTVLSLAAWTGSTHVAKCIVEKNRNLLTIENEDGRIPVTAACYVGQKEMTYYLYSETPPEVLDPQNGDQGLRNQDALEELVTPPTASTRH
ncbi:hypothetical protein SLEP1_g43549 [Rubroshorea leprosula]|uniref:DUF4219 domain-containing protein n=1 Tax=Rubroshorea leprosula TaxID=152421 RepID=A0AAV5LDP5_9ROSI|nr:hypothetical protein SLEP1_g43549 [Rubroshorea leprosula]